MKKVAFIIALSVLLAHGVKAAEAISPKGQVVTLQDRIEIAAEDLPQAIKDTIDEKSETKDLTISKAYQVTDEEGNVIYEVKFGTGERSIEKKYDAEGKILVEE
ncbi:hypothetical protein DN752_16580 [Echinicola strongylocentroti]|uniref:PepSY domain-containing protein n=1 Tax=Echinicola strongylocentroti TaxID=1795355 RepID=A0A2Z4IM06_9BACT|nr:hypothetical protein [Echinicola strongylocentroti]AWW31608.1 hypothetical protein DN752_16580 [Echinicola strongylocentroti]